MTHEEKRNQALAAVVEVFRPNASKELSKVVARALDDIDTDLLVEAATRLLRQEESCFNPIAGILRHVREVKTLRAIEASREVGRETRRRLDAEEEERVRMLEASGLGEITKDVGALARGVTGGKRDASA